MKKAIVVVNLGTPDKPEVREVRKYLTQFLNDARVIDIPWLARKLLVNGIIIPFRVKNSTRLYQQLWSDKGSPLLMYLISVTEKLQERFKDSHTVYGAMRYGQPSLTDTLKKLEMENVDEIVVVPLFPQYASSTTGSIFEMIMLEISRWNVIPAIKMIDQFYTHPAFINAFVKRIKSYRPEEFDHVIFSYHGLPIRQINKVHPHVEYGQCDCEKQMPAHGSHCYKAACYATTRALVQELKLPEDRYSTAFQSRLSKNWLMPFMDKMLIGMAQRGIKKILVTAPSFVADCLETKVEIEKDYRNLFVLHGGTTLVMVDSLNDMNEWVDGLSAIITEN
jgi:protoporphyrin/coproporphyrin ferrochelatase